jgi:DNA-binding NtrC family response regulator
MMRRDSGDASGDLFRGWLRCCGCLGGEYCPGCGRIGVDLALVDIKLGVDNGIDLLRKLKQMYPYMPVIMITGFGTVALTKEAFKIGAHDFLEKPLRLIQVRTSVRNALEGILLRKQLRKNAGGFSSKPVIVSDALKKVYQQASRLAQVKEPVVIRVHPEQEKILWPVFCILRV